MPAAEFPLEIEEGADLAYEFTYRDADGNAVDVSNYGATLVMVDGKGRLFYKGSDVDGHIQIGDSNGKIILAVPSSEFDNVDISEGAYQLYVYPTSGDITDRPRRLLKGPLYYSKSYLNARS